MTIYRVSATLYIVYDSSGVQIAMFGYKPSVRELYELASTHT